MTRGARAQQTERLSRVQIVDEAMRVVESDGLAALSLRRLAERLHVTPMALYWHVADKDALREALVERLLASIRYPDSDPALRWDERLQGVFTGFAHALRSHRAIAELTASRVLLSEPGQQLAETVLGLLAEAGFDAGEGADLAGNLLCSVIALAVEEPGAEPAELAARKRAALAEADATRFPVLRAASAALLAEPARSDYVQRGITVLVRGVAAIAPRTGTVPG
ncbi:MAG TPA: TetR/AcrR family transcriptional regulator C-terminal domain-containing protein [Gryllotalpicola sp.]